MAQRVDLTAELRNIPAVAALPAEALHRLAQAVYTELEYRVGTAISAGLTDAQLLEFETLIDYEAAHPGLGPHGPATAWLAAHRPGYPATVKLALEQILAETAAALTPGSSPDPGPGPGTQ